MKTLEESYRKRLDEALKKAVRELSRIDGIERVILFGSYAKGRADLFTDIDPYSSLGYGHRFLG
ncbi:MAG: nucleotidyltransferase domain-containing protein [bacterium]